MEESTREVLLDLTKRREEKQCIYWRRKKAIFFFAAGIRHAFPCTRERERERERERASVRGKDLKFNLA